MKMTFRLAKLYMSEKAKKETRTREEKKQIYGLTRAMCNEHVSFLRFVTNLSSDTIVLPQFFLSFSRSSLVLRDFVPHRL